MAAGGAQHNKGIAMSVGCTSVCVCEGCIYCAFEHVQVYLCVCRILNENLNVKVTRRLEPSHAESVLQLLLVAGDADGAGLAAAAQLKGEKC